AINLMGADTLTINGKGASLDGVFNGFSIFRGLFVYSGKTTIENLTIKNATASGGASSTSGGGGGGAGLGGGLFVANNSAGGAAPAQVTLDNVFFIGNSAVGGHGGEGGTGASGGGGLGGPGARGGGGVGSSASGGGVSNPVGNPGGAGIIAGAAA